MIELSLKALFSHFRLLGLPDYLSDDPFYACTPPLLPQRLTPCHIHHSRTVDLQQKSPQRSYFHCGCTACQIWLLLPQRPVGICKNESFYSSFVYFHFPCTGQPKTPIWVCLLVKFTQHDPQDPWSRICGIVGQSGHFLRASKLSGSFIPSVLWNLKNKMSKADKGYLLTVTCVWACEALTHPRHRCF